MAEIPPLYRPSQPILHVLRVKPAQSEQENLSGGKRKCTNTKKVRTKKDRGTSSFCFNVRYKCPIKVIPPIGKYAFGKLGKQTNKPKQSDIKMGP